MSRLTSAAAVFAAAAAMVLTCGLSTAVASPAPAAGSSGSAAGSGTAPASVTARPDAALGVCASTALSGHAVRGALAPAEVQRRLSSLTAQHRVQYGIAAKGPLGAPGSTAGPAAGAASATATGTATDSASGTGLRPLLTIHPAQGTSFKSLSGADGSCATQSVSTQLSVNESSTTIYTPTMYPPGGSCVELVTVYTRYQRSVSAWDWCQSVNFAASVPINSSFLSTYTNGSGAYTGRVVKTSAASNTWSASLYNYTTGQWDTLFTQSGTNQSGRTDGWDIEELYSSVGSSGQAYSCAEMSGLTFESSSISVRNNGSWSPASTANADTHYDAPNSAFYCPSRSYQMISAYDHWKVVG